MAISRRRFLAACALASIVPAALPRSARGQAAGMPAPLSPTPSCAGREHATPRQTEGPFYKPSSPARASLIEPGIAGSKLVVTGFVLAADCRPLAGTLLDFWQADDEGDYDNSGFRLRGHQYTDKSGRYRLETIVPGSYPGRTRHIHVKVASPGRRVLTTQLYFPGEARNAADALFDPRLLISVERDSRGPAKLAAFDFVLA